MYSDEKDAFADNDPTWLGIGYIASDAGLLAAPHLDRRAFWWSGAASRSPAGSSPGSTSIYLVLLAVAWLAMSGKWGVEPPRFTKALRRTRDFHASGE